MKRALSGTALAAVLLFVPMAPAADSGRELIRQGNAHYAAGRYDKALECYDAAAGQADVAGSAELLHDRAAALYKLGKVDEARDLWVRLKESQDAAFEARTRYNLGNCDYTDALATAGQNGQKAVELLGQAVEQYREALRLNPALGDARANLELTQLLKRQIEEQQQNQQQNQDSKGGQKSDQQQSSTQPSQSQADEQDQKNQQPNREQSESQPSQSPESQKSSPEEQDQQEEESKDQPRQEQQQPEQPPQSQPGTQPSAAESQPSDRSEEDAPSVPIEMTREQAERLLQKIRDAEKARREKLAQERMSRQKPVERDW